MIDPIVSTKAARTTPTAPRRPLAAALARHRARTTARRNRRLAPGDRVELVTRKTHWPPGSLGTVEWVSAWGWIVNVSVEPYGGDSYFARREVRLVQRAD